MQFLVGSFTCEMSLDDDGKVVTTWRLGDGRETEAPKYLNRAERKQYQAGRKAFLESLEDHPSTLRQAQDAQDQRPRGKAQGKDSTTKTSIIFTVAAAALASGLIGGATAALSVQDRTRERAATKELWLAYLLLGTSPKVRSGSWLCENGQGQIRTSRSTAQEDRSASENGSMCIG